jgi:uroporphyrinogen-III synthase
MDRKGVFAGARVAIPGSADFNAVSRMIRLAGARLHRFSIDSAEPGARPLESWIIELFEGGFDDVVFFTAQGVRLIVEFARQLDREAEAVSALKAARKIAFGPKVAGALREIGLRADVTSASSTADSLLAAVANLDVHGRVTGLASLAPDPRITETLERRGATLRLLSRSNVSDAAAVELFELVTSAGLDSLVFSASAQVERLWDVACVRSATSELRAALARTRVTYIGAGTELALRQHGIVPAFELSRAAFVRPQLDEVSAIVASRDEETAAASGPRARQAARGRRHRQRHGRVEALRAPHRARHRRQIPHFDLLRGASPRLRPREPHELPREVERR